MQPDMNSMIRNTGNRARRLPNIGQTPLAQTPAVQVADIAMARGGVGGGAGGAAGGGTISENGPGIVPSMPGSIAPVQGAGLNPAGLATPPFSGSPMVSGSPMPTPGMAPQAPLQGSSMPTPGTSPYGAPRFEQPITMHPPGQAADPNIYNYEPHPSGGWLVYPPGVGAPPHQPQVSLPRAASTADYRRMRQAFRSPWQF